VPPVVTVLLVGAVLLVVALEVVGDSKSAQPETTRTATQRARAVKATDTADGADLSWNMGAATSSLV